MAVPFLRRPAVLLALALCSVGGVVTLLGRLAGGSKAEEKRVPLAADAGAKSYPAFSPDGQRIAYSARAGKSDAFHIFVRALPADTPRALTAGEASDVSPAWSPDGSRIAFLRLEEDRAEYLVIPAGGGAERKVAEFPSEREESQQPPAVAWSADGKSLIVIDTGRSPAGLSTVAIEGGAVTPLTTPPAGAADSTPVLSPDRNTLAFGRSSGAGQGDVYLCDSAGKGIRRLTFDDHEVQGIAWTPDGQDIVYAANRSAGRSQLWRVPAYGGSPRMLTVAGLNAAFPAIAPSGNRLVYVESASGASLWRARLNPGGEAEEDRELVRSTGRESWPAYSPDGRRLAYISDQTGADEVWLCDAEGANPLQLTHFNGSRVARPRWSPDGRLLLIAHDGARGPGLYTIPVPAKGAALAAGTKPVPVVPGSMNGNWSLDGKKVYFDAGGLVWRVTLPSGPTEKVTSEPGTGQAAESVDGKYVYYRARGSIWRVPVAGGKEEEVFAPENGLFFTTIEPVRNGIYYLEWERRGRGMAVSFYDFAARKSSVVLRMNGVGNFARFTLSFSVSPDGKYIVYPKVDRDDTSLMMLEHFR